MPTNEHDTNEQKEHIGDILIRKTGLDKAYVEYALDVQKTCGLPVGEILIANNLVTERDVYGAIAEQYRHDFLESIDADEIDLPHVSSSDAKEMLESLRVMKENLIVPLKGGRIAVTYPKDVQKFFIFTGVRDIVVATPTAILTAIEKVSLRHYENMVLAPQTDKTTIDETIATFLDMILRKAIVNRASDIHFEIEMPTCVVRFRIDGDLYHQMTYPLRMHSSIANIILVRATGSPSNDQRIDDGSFSFNLTDKVKAFFRLSKLPTVNGADICLRVIRQDSMLLSLDKVGFLDSQVETLRKFMHKPHGVILLAGPTGSGKSTTLYSMVNEVRGSENKTISAEDPIEVSINFVTQVQVNREAGIDFGTSIRGFMRHDPDVILVGEIRDKETAKMAIEASMTGHLVLSSIHANNVFDVFTRLLDLDVSYRKMTAIVGIVSQRLVKKKCTCTGGCARCGGTGFYGRVVISEILSMTNKLRGFLYKDDIAGFIQHAQDKGFKPIDVVAQQYIDEGITTREEVEKWIDLESEDES